MELSLLLEPERHPAWPAIEALLRPAARYGGVETFEPGVDWLWIAFEGPTVFAAAVTRFYEDGDAELRMAAGTRLNDWVGLLDAAVSAWARDGGAHKLIMRGRKGWERFSDRFGWVATGNDEGGRTMFEKEL